MYKKYKNILKLVKLKAQFYKHSTYLCKVQVYYKYYRRVLYNIM